MYTDFRIFFVLTPSLHKSVRNLGMVKILITIPSSHQLTYCLSMRRLTRVVLRIDLVMGSMLCLWTFTSKLGEQIHPHILISFKVDAILCLYPFSVYSASLLMTWALVVKMVHGFRGGSKSWVFVSMLQKIGVGRIMVHILLGIPAAALKHFERSF